MQKNYKVVLTNEYNYDEDLIDFFETAEHAEVAKPVQTEKYKDWIKDVRMLAVKSVDVERIPNAVATDYSHYCRSLIPDDEWMRVIKSDASAEIHAGSLMCGYGGREYYYLSRMIKKSWTVIDIGCAYNAQAYFFVNHARYIAVNPDYQYADFHFERFRPEGTEYYDMTGQAFIRDVLPNLNLELSKTFAICHWVPSEECQQMVRATFPNCFVVYP